MRRTFVIGMLGVALILIGVALAILQFAPEPMPPARSPTNTARAPSAVPVTPPPPAPVQPPSFDVVRINPAGDAVMAGRASPNATVVIMDGEREIGRVQADARGEWVFVPNQPLPPGTRALSLSVQGPDRLLKSDNVVVLAVPERGRDLAGRPATDAPALAVATPREGIGRSMALQVPTTRAPGSGLALDVIDYDEKGHVVFGGRAAPGSSVQVYLDNRLIGRVQADKEGIWTLIPDAAVAPGVYTVRVDQLGPDGRVAARVELPFSHAETRQVAAGENQIVVQPGNSLWRIARRTYGQGTRFTVLYEANREQIRDVDLIYPGQVFVIPKVN